jgi:Secretion system C-terminal sorting domain/PKD domain
MNPLPPRFNLLPSLIATNFSFQNRIYMLKLSLTIWITVLCAFFIQAQSGCPGCAVSVPAGMPADTVYLPDLPDGIAGTPYDQDISFRLPKTTTPVNAIDSTTPPGLTISKFEIVSITGLPPGMYWQPNKFNFNVGTETDGCIKICGTPSGTDTFHLKVTLKATVLLLTQTSSFPMTLYIAPKVSSSAGFSVTDPEGCGSTTATFTNNVPSGGAPGFTYSWDFGDGSPVYTGETPPPHTYNQVGEYTVSYHAHVDTAGFILKGIRVITVECVDELGIGKPDLYMQVFAPNNGPKVFDSSPHLNNTTLPYLFPMDIKLGDGNYTLKVIDEDSGIKGSDDDCGTISFNKLSNGEAVAGGLKVEFIIVNPQDDIYSKDTIYVYPQPIMPVLNAANGLSACAGETDLVLMSSYGSGNQWLLNGENIPGATDFIYSPTVSGAYQAQIISQYGCVATSAPKQIVFHPLPAQPVWYNYNNSLRVYDTAALPAQYSLQWYLGTNPIPGATGIWYCSKISGNYGLVVTDLATGCTSTYANLVVHNPQFDCLVGTQSIEGQSLTISPNPATGHALIILGSDTGNGIMRLWDVTGRMVLEQTLSAGQESAILDVSHLSPGLYAVEVMADGLRRVGKLAVAR